MYALITDRTQQNVSYRNNLAEKGWRGMTVAEKAEWSGDPMVATGANLLPYGPQYSSSVTLKYRSDSITATANYGGIYLYAVSIIGEASQYEGKTFTLSVDHVEVTGGGLPQLAMYWHDDTGFEYAGASLFTAGSVTFDTRQFPNTAGRGYLAMYVGLAVGATAVLVPEEPIDFDRDVIEKIRQARLNGFTHYMIVVAEGAGSAADRWRRCPCQGGRGCAGGPDRLPPGPHP